ncbi:hypothetical protein [Paenisporosarcina quisquiliarum]
MAISVRKTANSVRIIAILVVIVIQGGSVNVAAPNKQRLPSTAGSPY